MREVKIVVIDDDFFRREFMASELDRSDRIAVVHAISQDEARAMSDAEFGKFDIAVVEVVDENARGEVGTDMFSGISALQRLQRLDVRTIAISPHRHHPLVEQRIYQAGTEFLYRQWEINDPDRLEHALLEPDDLHRVRPGREYVLRRHGAKGALTNDAVKEFEESMLHGNLYIGQIKRATGLSRRKLDGFVVRICRTGFQHPDGVSTASWREVRDYVLVLMGRKDAPVSDEDSTSPPH
jgi:hypothetical protein